MKQLHTIGIIGAMEAEIALLKSRLQNLQTHQFGQQITIYTGEIGNKNIILSLSGIGKVNAAIATTLVIEHFSPDCIINTGCAGGIGAGVRVGDIVISLQTAHHDVDVTEFGYKHGQVPQQPLYFTSDDDLVMAAAYAARAFKQARVVQGLIVSGDCFVHSKAHLERIFKHFPNAQAVEMEAAAIAQTCVQLDKPFVVVRAISDTAQEEAKVSFDEFVVRASQRSAQMVLNLIEAV